MERTRQPQEKHTQVDSRLAEIKEEYGEENVAELIAIFSAAQPEASAEEIADMIYKAYWKDIPASTSWPVTYLDRVLTFKSLY